MKKYLNWLIIKYIDMYEYVKKKGGGNVCWFNFFLLLMLEIKIFEFFDGKGFEENVNV